MTYVHTIQFIHSWIEWSVWEKNVWPFHHPRMPLYLRNRTHCSRQMTVYAIYNVTLPTHSFDKTVSPFTGVRWWYHIMLLWWSGQRKEWYQTFKSCLNKMSNILKLWGFHTIFTCGPYLTCECFLLPNHTACVFFCIHNFFLPFSKNVDYIYVFSPKDLLSPSFIYCVSSVMGTINIASFYFLIFTKSLLPIFLH